MFRQNSPSDCPSCLPSGSWLAASEPAFAPAAVGVPGYQPLPYRIGVGDQLDDVRLYQTPELNLTAIPVPSDGKSSVEPLGDVEAAGSTHHHQLTARLVTGYSRALDETIASGRPKSTIANVDLFVKEYINDLLPVQPVLPRF